MADPLNWGILAPGRIAHQFAKGLTGTDSGTLYAVGSRSQDRAREFASTYGAERAYGSYDELVADEKVDAIYIANPHTYHKESALLCLNAGKPVLCEKPFAVNAGQVKEMVEASRRSNTFLMEAMWTRFLPAMQQASAWIAAGRIGEIRRIDAHFGFRAGYQPEERLLNPDLAGGALLDVGIYVVSLAYWIMRDDPAEVSGFATIGDTGVDEQNVILLRYANGALATLSSAVRTATNNHAVVYGTEGRIEFSDPFFKTTSCTLICGEERVEFDEPFHSNGYEYQAIEVAKRLAKGDVESPLLPREESLRIVGCLDSLREQWNLRYPFER